MIVRLLVLLGLLGRCIEGVSQVLVPMERSGGVYLVPCKVNGLALKFIFDTGASDVSISLSEAGFMLKNGYLDETDLLGTEKFRIANGEVQEGTIVNIRSLEIGTTTLRNVPASIVHTMSAPLLLGQSALTRFGGFSVNYTTNVLLLGEAGTNTGGASTTVQGQANTPPAGRIELDSVLLGDYESQLLREAYARLCWEVRASHILIQIPPEPTPADTLAAWKRIVALRDRVMAGEAWPSVAVGPMGSDDPSASKNAGDLGWFSVLQMVYPFETVAYTTDVGQISQPFRTRFGYHFIKVQDRRPARGQVRVAHIMVRSSDQDSPEAQRIASAKIKEVAGRLASNELAFGQAALKYSDDESTNTQGGELPMFGTGKMIQEFEDMAFGLFHVGDITPTFRTPFGWHIVKLLERVGTPTFHQAKSDLWKRIRADKRYQP